MEVLLYSDSVEERSCPEVIKLFSCSAQVRLKFILLINVKMPTTEHEKRFITSGPVV